MYEIIALTMRLTHSLTGQEDRIRRYLDNDFTKMYPDQIESTFVVTTYSWSARMMGGTSLEPDEIRRWFIVIAARIDARLATPEFPYQRCLWLYLSALVRLHGSFMNERMPDPSHVFTPWLVLAEECAAAPAKWSPTPLASAARRGRKACASTCQRATAARPPAATAGWPTERLFQSARTASAKEDGETNHAERSFGTLRTRVSCLVRRACSFSKSVDRHLDAIHLFLTGYNLRIRKATMT